MGTHNGHGFQQLYEALFQDLVNHYPELSKDLARDLVTIRTRVASEGLSFLTKTLPGFCKAIDLSLATGAPLSQRFFSCRDGVPSFLRGFLGRIFDRSGLIPSPDPASVLEVRQICYLLYKLEVPYDATVISKKVEDFVNTDNSLPTCLSDFSVRDRRVLEHARACLGALFLKLPGLDELIPRHGPGTVAGREAAWEKMDFNTFYQELDEVFPYDQWFFLSPSHLVDELSSFIKMPEKTHGVSRAAFVPKDSRGPRMIAMEPKEYMWVQQAIKAYLYDHVESHPLTKGYVNFTNQEINRRLALEASMSGDYVTLDMSDASDRVSNFLVRYLFPPVLSEWLEASRTRAVELPDGRVHFYRKFAPMGSALCFPVEALVFWALIAGVLHEYLGVPLSISMRTYVYGDDIITHRAFADVLLAQLPGFGLKFNTGKCCIAGPFRESCGCDALFGVDVTPVKVKKAPKSRLDVGPIIAFVEYSNAFYERGYYQTGEFFKRVVEGLLGPLPCSCDEIIPLHLRSRTGYRSKHKRRWNKNYHRTDLLFYDVAPVLVEHECNGWSGVFRSVVCGSSELGPHVHAVQARTKLRKKWIRAIA